jgi:hypothetical protein
LGVWSIIEEESVTIFNFLPVLSVVSSTAQRRLPKWWWKLLSSSLYPFSTCVFFHEKRLCSRFALKRLRLSRKKCFISF